MSPPPSESPNDDQNGSQNNQNNQNNQNDEAGGQSNRPAAATNPTPTAELIDPGAIDDTAGATNSNEKGSSMGTLRVDVDGAFICLFVWEIRLTSHVFCLSQRLAFRSISCVQSRTRSSTIRSYTPTGTRTAGARYRRGYEGAKRRR